MLDEDDPFDLDEEDHNETPDKETLAKEDTPNDAAHEEAEKKPRGPSKTKRDQSASGRRDYGRSGITTPDPADLEHLTHLLTTSIKKLGPYETLTAIANAFERRGTELNSEPNSVGRGGAYLDAATTVDEIVSKLSNGTRA